MTIKEFIKELEALDSPDTVVAYDDNDYETGEGCMLASIEFCSDETCRMAVTPHIVIRFME